MKFLHNKKIIYIIPFITWLLSQVFIIFPDFFFISLSIGILLLALSVRGMEKGRGSFNWPLFFIFPAIFFLGISLYITFLPSYFWIQVILLFSSYVMFSYLYNIYHHFHYQAPERAETLESLMSAGGFLSVFALASSLYGLPTFLGWNFWILIPWFIVMTAPLFFQSFIFGSLKIKNNWPVFLIGILSLAELTLVIYFLPLSFNILGLFVAIFYYLILFTIRLILKEEVSKNVLRFPIFLGLGLIFVLLLTSRWL